MRNVLTDTWMSSPAWRRVIPSGGKLYYVNFSTLEISSRYRDQQLEVYKITHIASEWILIYASLSAQSWQYRDRRNPKPGLCPALIEWIQGVFIVHSTVDSTANSSPLNSLEHCICTTSINIGTCRSKSESVIYMIMNEWMHSHI